jgi:hypothetical protein
MSFVLEFTTYKNFMDEAINNKITQFNINTKYQKGSWYLCNNVKSFVMCIHIVIIDLIQVVKLNM